MQPPDYTPRSDGDPPPNRSEIPPPNAPFAPLSPPQTPPLPEPFGPSRPCPRCNTKLQPNAMFCPHCGERFDGKPLSCGQMALVGCVGLGAFLVGGFGSCVAALTMTNSMESQSVVWMILGGALIFAIFVMWILARSMRRR